MLSESFKRVSSIQDSIKVSNQCLHVNSVAGLVQAIGYIKWMVAESKTNVPYGVVFRGQCDNYSTMVPSLYRGISKTGSKPKRDTRLRNLYTSTIRNSISLNVVSCIMSGPQYRFETMSRNSFSSLEIMQRWLSPFCWQRSFAMSSCRRPSSSPCSTSLVRKVPVSPNSVIV